MTAAIPLDSIAALRAISADVCESIFAPPPTLTVSQWADDHRVLPPTSARKGRWRTDAAPYLRQIMDALGDETVREVLFVKSAQVGGTSCGENLIGYLIDQDPCGILMLWPTEKKLRSWSRKNLTPLLEETPCLAAKFPRTGRRDSGNTIAAKEFPNGFLQLLTAKSTSDLRSTSARYGIAEELDEIDAEIKGQGDPLGQFDARFVTFWNGKRYKVSTPTRYGASRTWTEWEASTQHRYYVPCPHCGERQVLRWREGEDGNEESGAYRLIWETDDDGQVIPGSACYLCEGCGVLIEERYKMQMLREGEWRAAHPKRYTVGFHINTLYSPFCTWTDIARAFLKAKNNPALRQTFDNLWLGLPYREKGEEINAHFLQGRAESYGEGVDVPHGVGELTAYVDVQGSYLELIVWGWGKDEESWAIAWERVDGDPGRPETWAEMDKLLLKPWRHASGAMLKIAAVAVDAGYQSEAVHRFCDARKARTVFATVGRGGRGTGILKEPEEKQRKRKRTGKKNRRPTHVIYVDTGKDLLHSRLKLALREDGTAPPGYVHFPDHFSQVFFDQLTSERLVTEYDHGRPVRVWKLPEGLHNEALDGAVGCIAALAKLDKKVIAGLGEAAKRWSEWTPDQASAPTPPRRMRRVRHAGL